MPIGVLLLVGVGALIFFGVAQRILDRLHLSDKVAILFILAMIAGSFVNITVSRSPNVVLNLGGGVIPLILAGYVLVKAGTTKEWIRAVIASLVTGGVIYGVANYLFFNSGHTDQDLVDPQYLFALIGGVVAYIVGRSRRSAFVAGVLGFLVYNIIILFRIIFGGIPGSINIGGAGIFDTMIISGIIAVTIAEIIGEIRERLGGGPVDGENRPKGLRNAEYANLLGINSDDEKERTILQGRNTDDEKERTFLHGRNPDEKEKLSFEKKGGRRDE